VEGNAEEGVAVIEETIDLIKKGMRHDALVEVLRELVAEGEAIESMDDWYAPGHEVMQKAKAILEEVDDAKD
jgi:hypothetical protein